MRWDDRQVLERPLALLDVVLLGQHQLEQVADGRRKHVFTAFEIVAGLLEAAERASDVGGDRRFFGDDEFLAHAARKAAEDTRKDCSRKALAWQSRVRRAEKVLREE